MHDEAAIEEQIRRRYRQPKGIEQFGVEPIPLEKKTVRGLDIFSIIFGFASIPVRSWLADWRSSAGLSFSSAVVAITGGNAWQWSPTSPWPPSAPTTGIPGQVATRMTFGLRGAK